MKIMKRPTDDRASQFSVEAVVRVIPLTCLFVAGKPFCTFTAAH
jgi:hypothetical protein